MIQILPMTHKPFITSLKSTLTHIFVGVGVGFSVLVIESQGLTQSTNPDINYRPNPGLATAPDNMNVYLLGPGDSLKVIVLGFDEYKDISSQVILPDGTISIPLVERFIAAGKTVPQVKQELTQRLSTYLVDPTVEVQLTNLRPLTVTVSGEVRRPGPLQLQAFSASSQTASTNITDAQRSRIIPTLSQAITAAGGVTREANLQDVTLTRSGINGVPQTLTLNLWAALQSGNIGSNDPVLRDGDSIFIPKAANLSQDAQRLMARSAFGSRTVKVRVVGEVKRPGEVELPPDSTLASAIANAGGPTDKADMGSVRFVRLLPNGAAEERKLNIAKLTEPTQIEDGDVLVVPKADVNRFFDAVSTVLSPLGAASVFIRLFQ